VLEYTLQTYSYGDHCQVSLTGNITLDESKAILTRLWNEPKYAQARSAIWDLSGCNTLPDFDEFLVLTRFIANEKAGRGPRTVVFTSPAFAAPLFARASGFRTPSRAEHKIYGQRFGRGSLVDPVRRAGGLTRCSSAYASGTSPEDPETCFRRRRGL